MLPLPRPKFEIFVYSPHVACTCGEAGSRGAASDGPTGEDFRTEVLGLMKAQMVKNAVIVPVGAKGGFVVKRPPTQEAARRSRTRSSAATRPSSAACST